MRFLLLLLAGEGLLVREGLARGGILLSVGLGFFLGLVGKGLGGGGRWAKALGDDGRLELPQGKHPSNETRGRRELGDDRGVVAALLMGVL